MPNFKTYNQSQGMFITLIPDELLESDHPARIIDAIVEKLNLEKYIPITAKKDMRRFTLK